MVSNKLGLKRSLSLLILCSAIDFLIAEDKEEIDNEGDEFIDFSYVIDKLAVRRNKAGIVVKEKEFIIPLPPCCASGACFIHMRNEKKVLESGDERPDFRLDVSELSY